MKFLHIADLHIGKRLHEHSLIEDQAHILERILDIARRERPDAMLIAGDVYDKPQPTVEAVELLDGFLTDLSALGFPTYLINGNHDSAERLHFGSRLMRASRVFLSGALGERMPMETLRDDRGDVRIYLLPYVRASWARQHAEGAEATQNAVLELIRASDVDPARRNVLIAHQFVAGGAPPETSDSESLVAGGLDAVSARCFDAFDYVALGHLHAPQRSGRDAVRYSGSPLKYSVSEARHVKSACVVELGDKGEVGVRLCPLEPLRDVRRVRGPLERLCAIAAAEPGRDDYVFAELTDEGALYDAVGELKHAYPNLLGLAMVGGRDAADLPMNMASEAMARRQPIELFAEFYEHQNGAPVSERQMRILREVFQSVGEGNA